MLAFLLVSESSRPFMHVGRTKAKMAGLPVDVKSVTLQIAEKYVKNKSFDKPSMIINLSGARDGENILSHCLAEGGFLVSPFASTQGHRSRFDVNLPLVAPGRMWIEKALEYLGAWSSTYELDLFLQPLSLENFHDLFISRHFKQSFIALWGSGE